MYFCNQKRPELLSAALILHSDCSGYPGLEYEGTAPSPVIHLLASILVSQTKMKRTCSYFSFVKLIALQGRDYSPNGRFFKVSTEYLSPEWMIFY